MTKWLECDGVSIAYGQQEVVRDCRFVLHKGEVLSLLGPSGCGKSTILKAIAGLLPISKGEIRLNGRLMSSAEQLVAPQARNVGMIFQDYALFPHMTVAENVAFGLQGLAKSVRDEKVRNMLELVQLGEFAPRYPHVLSGGQQQRVAIARAMVREPDLMLLDEPFSNLDNAVREQLMGEMQRLFQQHSISAVFVTHNKSEAFTLADQVAVMGEGTIAQLAAPQTLFDHPANEEIATFLGHGSLVRFHKNENDDTWQSSIGTLSDSSLREVMLLREKDNTVEVFLRPHQLRLSAEADTGNALIKEAQFLGDFSLYHVALAEQTIRVMCQERFAVGDRVKLALRL